MSTSFVAEWWNLEEMGWPYRIFDADPREHGACDRIESDTFAIPDSKSILKASKVGDQALPG